jgi:hypothetical protein
MAAEKSLILFLTMIKNLNKRGASINSLCRAPLLLLTGVLAQPLLIFIGV